MKIYQIYLLILAIFVIPWLLANLLSAIFKPNMLDLMQIIQ